MEKVSLIRQKSSYKSLSPENGFMLLLWWCSFKIQKEMGRPSVCHHRLFELTIDPPKNLLENSFKDVFLIL
jgi:hypothetical protein